MKTIGVRELRQNASVYLRLVEAGETIEVTSHGRPVGRIVPIRPGRESILDRMVREGRATRGVGDLLDVEPVDPLPGVPLPSVALEEERASYEW